MIHDKLITLEKYSEIIKNYSIEIYYDENKIENLFEIIF